jgi:hypothetical protein
LSHASRSHPDPRHRTDGQPNPISKRAPSTLARPTPRPVRSSPASLPLSSPADTRRRIKSKKSFNPTLSLLPLLRHEQRRPIHPRLFLPYRRLLLRTIPSHAASSSLSPSRADLYREIMRRRRPQAGRNPLVQTVQTHHRPTAATSRKLDWLYRYTLCACSMTSNASARNVHSGVTARSRILVMPTQRN